MMRRTQKKCKRYISFARAQSGQFPDRASVRRNRNIRRPGKFAWGIRRHRDSGRIPGPETIAWKEIELAPAKCQLL